MCSRLSLNLQSGWRVLLCCIFNGKVRKYGESVQVATGTGALWDLGSWGLGTWQKHFLGNSHHTLFFTLTVVFLNASRNEMQKVTLTLRWLLGTNGHFSCFCQACPDIGNCLSPLLLEVYTGQLTVLAWTHLPVCLVGSHRGMQHL